MSHAWPIFANMMGKGVAAHAPASGSAALTPAAANVGDATIAGSSDCVDMVPLPGVQDSSTAMNDAQGDRDRSGHSSAGHIGIVSDFYLQTEPCAHTKLLLWRVLCHLCD